MLDDGSQVRVLGLPAQVLAGVGGIGHQAGRVSSAAGAVDHRNPAARDALGRVDHLLY